MMRPQIYLIDSITIHHFFMSKCEFFLLETASVKFYLHFSVYTI